MTLARDGALHSETYIAYVELGKKLGFFFLCALGS